MNSILTQLTNKFSFLQNIPEIVKPTEVGQSIIISDRNSELSISMYVQSKNIKALFDHFNVTVPTTLDTLLQHSNSILLDLNSVTSSDKLRFYIHSESFIDTYIKDTYKFDDTLESFTSTVDPRLMGIGFSIDPTNDLVLEYKYYWYYIATLETHNYRFDNLGMFVNLTLETAELNISQDRLNEVILDGLEVSVADYRVNYITRDSHQYLIFMKNFLAGAGNTVPPEIIDLNQGE